MNPPKKLTSRQQTEAQEQAATQQQGEQAAAQEFATPEAMIRHDRVHTPVPPGIGKRVKESVADLEPEPAPSWWRRIFGGSGS
jgi:hypothetical protein